MSAHPTNLVSFVAPEGTNRARYGRCGGSGHEPAMRVGRDLFETTHPEDLPRARAWFPRLAAAPCGLSGEDPEVRSRHADGSGRQIRIRGTNPVSHPTIGSPLAGENDETGRRLARQYADRPGERLHLAAESLRMGLFECDVANDRFAAGNECYRLHGLRPPADRRVRGCEMLSAIHPDDRETGRAALERVVRGPAAVSGMRIMRYRANVLGGDLLVGLRPSGKGARVACIVTQPGPAPSGRRSQHSAVAATPAANV